MTRDWEFRGLVCVKMLYPHISFTGGQVETSLKVIFSNTSSESSRQPRNPEFCSISQNIFSWLKFLFSKHCLGDQHSGGKNKIEKCRNPYSGQISESSEGLSRHRGEELFGFTPAEHLMPNITNEVTKPNNAPILFPYNHCNAPHSCFQLCL